MSDNLILGKLLEAQAKYGQDKEVLRLGHEMFRLFTQMGFPPDFFLDKLKETISLNELQTMCVVTVYQHDFLEHRRLANTVSEEKLAKIQRHNLNEIKSLVFHGEVGSY